MFGKYQWTVPADATINQAAGSYQASISQVTMTDNGIYVLVSRTNTADGSVIPIQCQIQGADFMSLTGAAVNGATQGAAINAAIWASVQAKYRDLISFNRQARTGETVPTWAAV